MPAPRPPSRRMSVASRSTTSCLPTGSRRDASSRRCRPPSDGSALPIRCTSTATISALAGSADTAAATIAAAEGKPLHLAHLQFYGYGTEGKRKFSSAAARLAELVNATPEVTIDVGQVMFGQTVTVSSDVLRQFSARASAQPKKFVIHDGDGNGGGIVPYRYRPDFYGSVQWAAGLELFLLIDGSLAGLLHHRPPERRAVHGLSGAVSTADEPRCPGGGGQRPSRRPALGTDDASLDRARIHALAEIAIMTRAAPGTAARPCRPRPSRRPARSPTSPSTARAADIAAMFRRAAYLFKDGELVVEDGVVTRYRWGRALRAPPSAGQARWCGRLEAFHQQRYGLSLDWFTFPGQRHHARKHRSARCHAGPERQRRRHRRHLCRGVRHAGDGARHHRPEPQVGAPGGSHHDRLRHVGDRLRLRGGNRCRSAAVRRRPTGGRAAAS